MPRRALGAPAGEQYQLVGRVVQCGMLGACVPAMSTLMRSLAGVALVALACSQTFCVIEVVPAAYIVLAANEAEKAARITLNHYTSSGAYGRLMISGSDSAVRQSRDAAISAVEALDGRISG